MGQRGSHAGSKFDVTVRILSRCSHAGKGEPRFKERARSRVEPRFVSDAPWECGGDCGDLAFRSPDCHEVMMVEKYVNEVLTRVLGGIG
jgi:hypothetical protein